MSNNDAFMLNTFKINLIGYTYIFMCYIIYSIYIWKSDDGYDFGFQQSHKVYI
jgi:hypothetical protein